MSYTEWTRTSTAYRAYTEAAQRCAEAFAPRPKAELNEWVHPRTGQVRRYVNNIAELIGIEVSRYNTGNISGASLDGNGISNSQAYKILTLINDMKVWADEDGKLHWYAVTSSNRHLDADDIIDAVRAAL